MSVIMEAQEGDSIVIITDFTVCEERILFNWESSKDFKIGDVVYYSDFIKDEKEPQEYLSWFVQFKDNDGKTYSASQLYFVTMDEWEDLEEYFKGKK